MTAAAHSSNDASSMGLAKRHPVFGYFVLTFTISWVGVLVAIRGRLPADGAAAFNALLPLTAIAMVLGPSLSGILMTLAVDGIGGLKDFRRRAFTFRASMSWYAFAALTAPVIALAVMYGLSFISAGYRPGILAVNDKAVYLQLGIGLSVLAGIFEEVGWTGFATPARLKRYSVFRTGAIIGFLWSAWHLLVGFWATGNGYAGRVPIPLFLGVTLFTTLFVYRILMVWVYEHTRSLPIAIVMHASLTAAVRIVNPVVTGAPLLWYDIAMAGGLWIVVAAIGPAARSRLNPHQRRASDVHARLVPRLATIDGFVSPGFEPVRDAFIENFSTRDELGGACCVYRHGEKVVDLWGGVRNAGTGEPWLQHTMVVVYSATKGLAAMTLAIAHSRGWLDYDERVATYWPEFAQRGKSDITVRQLLAHQAGLFAFDEPVGKSDVADLDRLASILARQTPAWKAGTRQSYHALTLGFYENELVRRVDPLHRSLGQFFEDEIATPLGLDFYIRVPESIPNDRLAVLHRPSLLTTLRRFPIRLSIDSVNPRSDIHRALIVNPGAGIVLDPDRVYARNLEVPSGGGVGTAHAIAKAYGVFACGGHELGLTAETLAALTSPPIPSANGFHDDAMHGDVRFSLGFMRPGGAWAFGSDASSFGSPGAGGALGFADPALGLGYGYVTCRMGTALTGDPRDVALRAALYSVLAKTTTPAEIPAGV
jgi:CubicO group peptidase (beta-lactamase class C family)/membrane protease YdiL (CAAX protease family)